MIVSLLSTALPISTYVLLLLLENRFGVCAGMVQQQLIATWTTRLVYIIIIIIVFYNNFYIRCVCIIYTWPEIITSAICI